MQKPARGWAQAKVLSRECHRITWGDSYKKRRLPALSLTLSNLEHLKLLSKDLCKVDAYVYDDARAHYIIFRPLLSVYEVNAFPYYSYGVGFCNLLVPTIGASSKARKSGMSGKKSHASFFISVPSFTNPPLFGKSIGKNFHYYGVLQS